MHGDTAVRSKIAKVCNEVDDTICKFAGADSSLSEEKSNAVFCLEPAGDSPGRKVRMTKLLYVPVCVMHRYWYTFFTSKCLRDPPSLSLALSFVGQSPSDSVALGCIPVFFSDLSDDFAHWFWGEWKDRARVLVPRGPFVGTEDCIDLVQLLQSAPPQLISLMQETLRQRARRFQFSVDDDQEDGIRVILDSMHKQAPKRCV